MEGWQQWQAEHPSPSDEDMAVALTRFFRKRPDMTPEDFYAGRDPLLEAV